MLRNVTGGRGRCMDYRYEGVGVCQISIPLPFFLPLFRRLYFILYRKISWCFNRCVSNICQPSLPCMCVTLVVRRWSCTTNRVALRCIFSRVSILFWVFGFQAIDPYSNFGLTGILY